MRAAGTTDQGRMGDWIVNAMDRMQQTLDSASTGQVVLFFAISLVITPLSVVVHELGHALAARHYGADVQEFVASGEGPAATATVGGARVRLGLGLGRDLRSREALGLGPHRLLHADCAAGDPRALCGPGRPGPLRRPAVRRRPADPRASVLLPVMLGLCGAGSIAEAALNLTRDGHGRTDGAQVRAIRAGALGPAPVPHRAPRPPRDVGPSAAALSPSVRLRRPVPLMPIGSAPPTRPARGPLLSERCGAAAARRARCAGARRARRRSCSARSGTAGGSCWP